MRLTRILVAALALLSSATAGAGDGRRDLGGGERDLAGLQGPVGVIGFLGDLVQALCQDDAQVAKTL